MYVQYFLGLSNYTTQDVFDRSLFTTLRYRLGADKFDQMSAHIISTAPGLQNDQSENEVSIDASQNKDGQPPEDSSPSLEEQQPAPAEPDKKETESIAETPKAKGKLKLDATIADQMIKYR